MGINVVCCDDIPIQRELLTDLIQDYSEERHKKIDVVQCSSGEELLKEVDNNGSFDIYLLDLIMPDMTGMEVARRLRERGDNNCIIFITATLDYLLESYDVHSFFYLTKPVVYSKFAGVLTDAISHIENNNIQHITVSSLTGAHRVDVSQITHVALENRSLVYHLDSGDDVVTKKIRGGFRDEVEVLLENHPFIMGGSSMVINLEQVMKVGTDMIVFKNLETIYPPKRSFGEIKAQLDEYWN